MIRFSPRRPVKSFADLEVYQKLLAVSVAVAKRIDAQGARGDALISLALALPVKIAAAHSVRFSDKVRALAVLEEVMLEINTLIVYLEQYRDIWNIPPPKPSGKESIEAEFFEEQIRSLSVCRWKVMHLARSWEKFSLPHPQ